MKKVLMVFVLVSLFIVGSISVGEQDEDSWPRAMKYPYCLLKSIDQPQSFRIAKASGSLSSLRKVELPGNFIRDLTPLSNLPNLRYINLESNVIKDVKPLATLRNLEYLNLSDNFITDISPLCQNEEIFAKGATVDLSLNYLDLNDEKVKKEISTLKSWGVNVIYEPQAGGKPVPGTLEGRKEIFLRKAKEYLGSLEDPRKGTLVGFLNFFCRDEEAKRYFDEKHWEKIKEFTECYTHSPVEFTAKCGSLLSAYGVILDPDSQKIRMQNPPGQFDWVMSPKFASKNLKRILITKERVNNILSEAKRGDVYYIEPVHTGIFYRVTNEKILTLENFYEERRLSIAASDLSSFTKFVFSENLQTSFVIYKLVIYRDGM
jgi:hypothetical protein